MITGIKKRIMNDHNFLIAVKKGEPCKISSLALSVPQIHPTKRDNSSAPRASERVPNRKLIWLKKSGEHNRLGSMAKLDRKSDAPCDKADGMPTIKVKIVANHTTFLRLTFFSSTKKVTCTSKREMVDVKAATDSNTKKEIPTIVPAGIWVNNFGKIINTSAGP